MVLSRMLKHGLQCRRMRPQYVSASWLLRGAFSGVVSGVIANNHSIVSAVALPAIILTLFSSIPIASSCRWWPFRFVCSLVFATLAHFAFCGLMVSLSDASNPAADGAAMGAIFGTIGSFLFVFGFCCAFNPKARLEIIIVGTILGGLAASASGALLLSNQLNWSDDARLILAFVLWHGSLACSISASFVATRSSAGSSGFAGAA